jgi:lipopolysaccharide biosynthesis regulator YciM
VHTDDETPAALTPGREGYLEGLDRLREGDVDAAAEAFARAARAAQAPFDALSTVARGECERVRGRHGAAIRLWRRVATRRTAPPAARYMAWLSIAALAADRQDRSLLTRASQELVRLEDSGEI